MTTAAVSLQIVPESPPSAPALRAADQGVADALEVRPLRQHQARLRRPVATPHRLVWRRGPPLTAGRAAHRGPLSGGSRRLRRHHRHPATVHVCHRQGPPVGRLRIAL